MIESNAHIIAMTGSYFRGDGIPVLLEEDESRFVKVTYNYYEQLNGYQYLKSLGIGFHFYHGRYTSAIMQVLDTTKKTIIHIPNVNSGESTKDKYIEVDTIIDEIGKIESVDENNIIYVKQPNGRVLKIADLVNDTPVEREKVVAYLREVANPEDIDMRKVKAMQTFRFMWTTGIREQTLIDLILSE